MTDEKITTKALHYSATAGFRDIDLVPDWPDGMEQREWLAAAGFSPQPEKDGSFNPEFSASVDVYYAVGRRGRATVNGWVATVDVSLNGDSYDMIMVSSLSDLMALRLLFLPATRPESFIDRLETVLNSIDKTLSTAASELVNAIDRIPE